MKSFLYGLLHIGAACLILLPETVVSETPQVDPEPLVGLTTLQVIDVEEDAKSLDREEPYLEGQEAEKGIRGRALGITTLLKPGSQGSTLSSGILRRVKGDGADERKVPEAHKKVESTPETRQVEHVYPKPLKSAGTMFIDGLPEDTPESTKSTEGLFQETLGISLTEQKSKSLQLPSLGFRGQCSPSITCGLPDCPRCRYIASSGGSGDQVATAAVSARKVSLGGASLRGQIGRLTSDDSQKKSLASFSLQGSKRPLGTLLPGGQGRLTFTASKDRSTSVAAQEDARSRRDLLRPLTSGVDLKSGRLLGRGQTA